MTTITLTPEDMKTLMRAMHQRHGRAPTPEEIKAYQEAQQRSLHDALDRQKAANPDGYVVGGTDAYDMRDLLERIKANVNHRLDDTRVMNVVEKDEGDKHVVTIIDGKGRRATLEMAKPSLIAMGRIPNAVSRMVAGFGEALMAELMLQPIVEAEEAQSVFDQDDWS